MVALIVVDVQKGLFLNENPILNENELIENINRLIGGARANKMPVVFVQHEGKKGESFEKNSDSWKLHEGLQVESKKDVFIGKRHSSCFHGTGLAEKLRKWGVGQIIICGLKTPYCIDSTVRHGYSKEFKVILAKDAHSTNNTSFLDSNSIINHHNLILSDYAEIISVNDIQFIY